MLRKIIITTGLLGLALSFTLIGAPQARAEHIGGFPHIDPFPPMPCLVEIGGILVPCYSMEVGPISAEPGVVVTIPLDDETAAALETPAVELEPVVVLLPDEGEPEEAETGTGTEEVADLAPEPTEASSSDHEHTHVADTIVTEQAVPNRSPSPVVEPSADSDQETEVANQPEEPEIDSSVKEDTAADESDPVDESQGEMLADRSDTTGINSVAAALVGALGAIALFGAVILGVVLGRRAN